MNETMHLQNIIFKISFKETLFSLTLIIFLKRQLDKRIEIVHVMKEWIFLLQK